MQDLKGKTALVTGLANKRSIAYATAERLAAAGVTVAVGFQDTQKDGYAEKIAKLAEDFSPDLILPMDATDGESMQSAFDTIAKKWGRLDILVHSIASAKREELAGRTSDISLEGYLFAQQVSAYSLIEMVRLARPIMTGNGGGSVVALTYLGSERASRNYNVMGSAKAALESNVRYLAMELGEENIRVNSISAGPIRTLSASGIKDFLDLLHNAAEKSALKRNITAEEVANTVAFLGSDMASGITGQNIYVDGGFNIYG